MSSGKIGTAFKCFIILPPVLYLIALFIVPVSILWGYSFSEKVGITEMELTWTLEHYEKVFSPLYISIFLKSMGYSFVATIICLLLGFVIALGITSIQDKRMQIVTLVVIMLPFWINMLIRVYALMVILRRKGLVNSTYTWVMEKLDQFVHFISFGTVDLIEGRVAPLKLLYQSENVIMGLVYVFLPFTVLPLYSGLSRINKSYFEASYDLGGGHFSTIFSVILPILKPALITALMLTFIPMLGQFLIPNLMGGRDSIMIANVIASQFKAANNWGFGAALSFALIYITLIGAFIKIITGREKEN